MEEKIKNHERNQDIEYNDDAHTYKYQGEKYFKGVTSLIGKYTKPFNAKKIAKSLASYHPDYRHLTPEGVLEKWDEAREYGNKIDKQLEDWVNYGIDCGSEELEQIKEALNFHSLEPICSQWVIYDESIDRASAVDLVCLNANDEIVVVDLKTMEKPIKKKAYKDKKMSYPLNSLPDAKYWKQNLQIEIYNNWIKNLYELPTAQTHYILRVRPEFWEMIPVLNLEKEIKELYEFEQD